MHTTMGDVEIELWPKEAPLAVRNFVQLALERYYDGLEFHRVVPGFIVQSGGMFEMLKSMQFICDLNAL